MEPQRILVIEDDAAQRELFKTALTGAGYDVFEAPDGQVGVAMFQQHPCDLILTDLFMPNEDGIETIFEIKSRHPEVCIIAISGGGRWAQSGASVGAQEPLDMATHFGADRTLKKPIKLQELLDMVADLLHRAPSPPELSENRVSLVTQVARKRVLIIEDDPSQRQLFKTALEQAGYEVVEAANGRIGLEYYRQQPCELVITDIFMPTEDGIETIFSLRAEKTPVKIIAISGGGKWAFSENVLGADEPLAMAKRFGADRTLNKPIKLRQLVALADELLNIKGRLSPG